jgi:RimJ/RimL family protein N-acetyltransferase
MILTPILEGFGVRLEPIREEHAAAIGAIALDPSIWRYMNLRMGTAADVRAWVSSAASEDRESSAHIWVTRLASGEAIGSTRLFDLDLHHRRGEIGFTWLTEAHRGSGVNPRVKLLQLTHAFEGLRLRRVALKTHHENLQSQRGILKLGAKYEGTFRNHMLMPDGSTRNTVWYSIIADEWPSVKERMLQRIAARPLPTSH